MGALDDAIREHLELKRKHGAPEEELRRQEEEALGPVRREVAPPDEVLVEGDGEPAAEAQEPAVGPVSGAGEPAEPAPFDAETSLLAEMEPFPEEEASAVPQPAEPAEPLPAPEESEEEATVFDPPDEAALRGDGRTAPTMDEEGAGADPEDEPRRADEGADPEDEPRRAGDVLEDTPDFLEETPEHDRLWFEQRPPRDFDFD
jgi:hypothetical protein